MRRIVNVLIGFGVAFGVALLLSVTLDAWTPLCYLIRRSFPPFVGGIITGFLIRQRGWVFGLIVAGILEAFGLLLNFWAFSWAEGPSEVFGVWSQEWLSLLIALIIGSAGGHLGELLAKKILGKQNM